MQGIAGVAVIKAHFLQHHAHQPDVCAAVNLPDRADDVPRDQQRKRDQNKHQRRLPAVGRHGQSQRNAKRDLDSQHGERERELPPQRSMKILIAHDGSKPFSANKNPPLRRNDVLYRIVDNRHQGQDGREGDTDDHRQHQQPGLLVHGFGRCAHATNSSFL